MVATEEVIAIVEICVYIPVFLLTLIVVFRHGFQRQLGWIYLAIFCAVRLAGAGFRIASIHDPTNTTDIEWASILQSVGLSPLLMTSLGLLKRITDEVSDHVSSGALDSVFSGTLIGKIITKRAAADSRRSRIIQVAALPATIALILCIVGGINQASSDPSEVSTGRTYTKVGIVIFLVIYILLFGLAVITIKDVANAPRGEKRIYFAVAAALPLLAVRLLWGILAAFANSSTFSIVSPQPYVQLFMATLEELIIACMYTLVGLTVQV